MNDPGPNYRMYNADQLQDALEHIDKERFPDRVTSIEKYIKEHRLNGNASKDKTIKFSQSSNTIFALISFELVFWLVLGGLGLLGFSIW